MEPQVGDVWRDKGKRSLNGMRKVRVTEVSDFWVRYRLVEEQEDVMGARCVRSKADSFVKRFTRQDEAKR